MGVVIVGASFAGPAKNAEWITKQEFAFEVWDDDDKTLALHYGAVKNQSAPFPDRITKVLDADGTLILEYVDQIDVGTHPADVLDDCKKIFGEPAP